MCGPSSINVEFDKHVVVIRWSEKRRMTFFLFDIKLSSYINLGIFNKMDLRSDDLEILVKFLIKQ